MMTGYLRRDLSAIADDLVFQAGQDVTEKEIETVLAIIQDFDRQESVPVIFRNAFCSSWPAGKKHLRRGWPP